MKLPEWDTARARKLLEEGQTDLQVAEAVGASLSALKSWKHRNGLVKSRPPRDKTAPVDDAEAQDTAPDDANSRIDPEDAPSVGSRTNKSVVRVVPVQLHLRLCGCDIRIDAPDIASAQLMLGLLPGIDYEQA